MSLPSRHHPRLKEFDYSQNGAYHIIIHLQQNAPVLSRIKRIPQKEYETVFPRHSLEYYGGYITELTECGAICYAVLKELMEKYPTVSVDDFVFMPTHIHLLLRIQAGMQISISDYVRAMKSKATVMINKQRNSGGVRMFQTSFYDHIIRNQEDYLETLRYIDNNPQKEIEGHIG